MCVYLRYKTNDKSCVYSLLKSALALRTLIFITHPLFPPPPLSLSLAPLPFCWGSNHNNNRNSGSTASSLQRKNNRINQLCHSFSCLLLLFFSCHILNLRPKIAVAETITATRYVREKRKPLSFPKAQADPLSKDHFIRRPPSFLYCAPFSSSLDSLVHSYQCVCVFELYT